MDLLSVLLLCKDPAASDLIAIMGECSSAKEVVMAAQEEMEKLIDRVEENGDDDSQDGEENGRMGEVGLVPTFVELVGLYRAGEVGLSSQNLMNGCVDYICSAIPRLKLRRRTASETLEPLFSNLQRAMEAVSVRVKSDEGKELMSETESMISAALKWIGSLPMTDDEEFRKCLVRVYAFPKL